jgi:hypothetical protein
MKLTEIAYVKIEKKVKSIPIKNLYSNLFGINHMINRLIEQFSSSRYGSFNSFLKMTSLLVKIFGVGYLITRKKNI